LPLHIERTKKCRQDSRCQATDSQSSFQWNTSNFHNQDRCRRYGCERYTNRSPENGLASRARGPEGQNRYWFIDEVSAVTGKWDEQIKWLRDNDLGFHDSTVVLTGSKAASLTAGAGTLAGRRGGKPNLDRILLPLGFRTFAQLASRGSLPNAPKLAVSTLRTPEARASYHNLIPWLDQLVELWEMYILYGGFPVSVAAAVQRAPIPDAFVDDLLNVVSADTFKASRLSVHTGMSLLDRHWLFMSSPANLVNIGIDVGISQDTVTRHVGYLRDALLLWHCPQKDENQWTPRLRAQDKLYAIDPLIAHLPHLRKSGRPDIDPTVLTEMQVGMAVNRRVRVQTVRITNDQFLFYFKTPTRKEIDFVSEVFAGVALEVKYIEAEQWNSEAATVNASNWHGLLVTRNVLGAKVDSAWAVPAGIICYLMDT
jgi:predicted AAA+ superfamily ATPase